MQYSSTYPINDLLAFLKPEFLTQPGWRRGFGVSVQLSRENIPEVQRYLRAFIGEWIDTGFQEDGSERPHERNFTPNWIGEAYHFPHALHAVARIFSGDLRVRGNIHRQSELVIMSKPGAAGNINLVLKSVGGTGFQPALPSYNSEPELIAAGFFLSFYDSPYLFSLMRCARCKAFSLLKTPIVSYKCGWHCAECKRPAGTSDSTKKSRAAKRALWFDRAVAACREWESSKRKKGSSPQRSCGLRKKPTKDSIGVTG